jgi:hypothetical protein
VFGVDEDILAPETVDDFPAGDDATLPLQKKDQQLHGDALEGNALAFLGAPLAAQLEAGGVELEFSESVLRLSHSAPKTEAQNYSIARGRVGKSLWRQWVRSSGFFTQSSPCRPCDFCASATGCGPKFEEVLFERTLRTKLQGDDL